MTYQVSLVMDTLKVADAAAATLAATVTADPMVREVAATHALMVRAQLRAMQHDDTGHGAMIDTALGRITEAFTRAGLESPDKHASNLCLAVMQW